MNNKNPHCVKQWGFILSCTYLSLTKWYKKPQGGAHHL